MSEYATLEALKARLDIVDTQDDAKLSFALSAASRAVESQCNRRFEQVTEIRYFTATCGYDLDVDDLVTLTTLQTDDVGARTYGDTWSATDYDLEPYNAASLGWPYTKLQITPQGRYAFPTVRRGVKITGVWGWPAVPAPVHEATLLLALRWFKRKDSPYGIAGSNELGQVQMMGSNDPDVKSMLAPYRRFSVGAF